MQTYGHVSDPALFYLKEFQSNRLRDTYADLAARPDHEAACDFFFTRVYSTEDSSDRDAAFKKIYHLVQKFLGGEVVRSMAKLIELQELTVRLDQKLIQVLAAIKAPVAFDNELYEKAYFWSQNYQERQEQIELLVFVNRMIHKISHRFGIGMVLKGLRAGCLVAGDTRMVDFLMAGYKAYAHLRKIEPLVEAIQHRETQRLDRIYRDYPQPPTSLEMQLAAL